MLDTAPLMQLFLLSKLLQDLADGESDLTAS